MPTAVAAAVPTANGCIATAPSATAILRKHRCKRIYCYSLWTTGGARTLVRAPLLSRVGRSSRQRDSLQANLHRHSVVCRLLPMHGELRIDAEEHQRVGALIERALQPFFSLRVRSERKPRLAD